MHNLEQKTARIDTLCREARILPVITIDREADILPMADARRRRPDRPGDHPAHGARADRHPSPQRGAPAPAHRRRHRA